MRNSKGITLVALVVTIIILLILAGITLNLAVGENGLVQKAQLASNTMANATANELTTMSSYKKYIKEASKGFRPMEDKILIIDSSDEEVDLSNENKVDYYGRDVIYNGKTYQIFYIDNTGKYGNIGVWLQLKNRTETEFRPYDHINPTPDRAGIIQDPDSILWKVNPDLNTTYGEAIRSQTSWNSNLESCAALCDTQYWNTDNTINGSGADVNTDNTVNGSGTDVNTVNKKYVPEDDEKKGAFVIGGVSAEMYCDSLNETMGSTATQFETKSFKREDDNRGNYGYLFKPIYSSVTVNIDGYAEQTKWAGISAQTKDGMYLDKDKSNIWLSSPSAVDHLRICYTNGWDGMINFTDGGYSWFARPAVFIPKGIEIPLAD